jgi:hypothetical protein
MRVMQLKKNKNTLEIKAIREIFYIHFSVNLTEFYGVIKHVARLFRERERERVSE